NAIYLHDTRSTVARPHEFEFLLAKPSFAEQRAIGGSQQNVKDVAAERWDGSAGQRLLLQFLNPSAQRIFTRTEVVVYGRYKQRHANKRAEKEKCWKSWRHLEPHRRDFAHKENACKLRQDSVDKEPRTQRGQPERRDVFVAQEIEAHTRNYRQAAKQG